MHDHELTIVASSRAFPGETVNGDVWTVERQNGLYRVALVDGLGHGPGAAEAAAIARETLAACPHLSPGEAMLACHRSLAGTRGAVALIVLFDPVAKRVSYAGIGNVEARLQQNGHDERFISYRGVLGASIPSIRTFSLDLLPGWLFVAHTDGVSSRFNLDALPQVRKLLLPVSAETDEHTDQFLPEIASTTRVRPDVSRHPGSPARQYSHPGSLESLREAHASRLQSLAATVLADWGRQTDDATVLVAAKAP